MKRKELMNLTILRISGRFDEKGLYDKVWYLDNGIVKTIDVLENSIDSEGEHLYPTYGYCKVNATAEQLLIAEEYIKSLDKGGDDVDNLQFGNFYVVRGSKKSTIENGRAYRLMNIFKNAYGVVKARIDVKGKPTTVSVNVLNELQSGSANWDLV